MNEEAKHGPAMLSEYVVTRLIRRFKAQTRGYRENPAGVLRIFINELYAQGYTAGNQDAARAAAKQAGKEA